MGADGGTIPKRCELVKAKKKKEKLDKNVKNANRWKNCQMTQEPLKVIAAISCLIIGIVEAIN